MNKNVDLYTQAVYMAIRLGFYPFNADISI